jgi:hypothetical protein
MGTPKVQNQISRQTYRGNQLPIFWFVCLAVQGHYALNIETELFAFLVPHKRRHVLGTFLTGYPLMESTGRIHQILLEPLNRLTGFHRNCYVLVPEVVLPLALAHAPVWRNRATWQHREYEEHGDQVP